MVSRIGAIARAKLRLAIRYTLHARAMQTLTRCCKPIAYGESAAKRCEFFLTYPTKLVGVPLSQIAILLWKCGANAQPGSLPCCFTSVRLILGGYEQKYMTLLREQGQFIVVREILGAGGVIYTLYRKPMNFLS